MGGSGQNRLAAAVILPLQLAGIAGAAYGVESRMLTRI
jgi:hypothetical protein